MVCIYIYGSLLSCEAQSFISHIASSWHKHESDIKIESKGLHPLNTCTSEGNEYACFVPVGKGLKLI